MSDLVVRRDGEPDLRYVANTKLTPEQRRERARKASEARTLNQRERHITELIEKAPPFREEQIARLMILLNGQVAS